MMVIDYGMMNNLVWVTFLRDSGECWSYRNPDIRLSECETMGVRQPNRSDTWRQVELDVSQLQELSPEYAALLRDHVALDEAHLAMTRSMRRLLIALGEVFRKMPVKRRGGALPQFTLPFWRAICAVQDLTSEIEVGDALDAGGEGGLQAAVDVAQVG